MKQHSLQVVSLLLLMAAVGCAKPASSSKAAPDEEDQAISFNEAGVETLSTLDGPVAYPEHAEVSRLLSRAAALELDGEFRLALELANRALSIDPQSPNARELKAKLKELLRRV